MRFLILLLSSLTLNAATYYIDATGGSDSNNGTSSGTPWQTLAHATNQVYLSGDLILLKRGEHWHESFVFTSSGVVLMDYGSGTAPIIDGDGVRRRLVDTGVVSNTITGNLILTNGGGGTGANWINSVGTNSITNCIVAKHGADACTSGNGDSHSILRNCFLRDAFDDGFTLHTTASGEVYSCTISNCSQGINHSGTDIWMVMEDTTFVDNTTSDIDGMTICPATFRRCKFLGRAGGTFTFLKGDTTGTTTFQYCTFNASQGSGLSDGAFTPQGANTVNLLNCVFYGGGVAGNMSLASTVSMNMTNCIIDHWWRAASLAAGAVLNMDHCITNSITTGTITSNTSKIAADPLFVGASTGNFHLQAGSPAIRAGINIGLTTDLDGHGVANPPSIGAYEFIVGPTISFSGNAVFSGRISQ